MKLIENKRYKLTKLTGHICTCNYAGVADGMECDICHKERKRTLNFINPCDGDMNNPSCQCFFGAECIKKINIVEVKS
jgi:hypothetical protein